MNTQERCINLKGTPLKVVLNDTQEEVDGFVAQIDRLVGLTIVADVTGTKYLRKIIIDEEVERKVFCLRADAKIYDYNKSFDWTVEQIKKGRLVIDEDPYPATGSFFNQNLSCAFE